MPTARSSTEPGRRSSRAGSARLGATLREQRRATADVVHLVRLRAAGADRRKASIALGVALGLSVASAVVPAFVEGAGGDGDAFQVLLLLPVSYAGFLGLTLVAAVASGGGRELLPREQAAAFPLSTTTDHLGALLMAPLNIAWFLQAWLLLGATAYAAGPAWLPLTQLVVLLWIALATALAQALAWSVEALRRGRHGVLAVRTLLVALVGGSVALQVLGRLDEVLDQVPTLPLVLAVVDVADGGPGLRWWLTAAALVALTLLTVVLGELPARAASRRPAREESRAETGHRPPRRMPRTDLGVLLRIDRASVWRAVPMRRGLAVLAVGPGLVSLAGALPWETLTVLPGLVASGGALLFGVNAWCLDGRGALWRASLPVGPSPVFVARTVVLTEWLLVASGATLVLGSLRAGAPTSAQLAALLGAWVVVTAQVVGASVRWSLERPYAVDLRSARATPAPPAVMVGYSARLALVTTLTGMLFSLLGGLDDPSYALLAALGLLLLAARRTAAAHRRWCDDDERARVVAAVAA